MTGEITAATFTARSEADIARARLAADGIPSRVVADDEGGLNPGFYSTYGVRLVVSEADLDDALTSLAIERVALARPLIEAMLAHAFAGQPIEACGLVLFEADRPVFVCCLTNADASGHRFTIDPAEHFGAIRFAERMGWRVGGVFHSHVQVAPIPSEADIHGGADPDWLHFIVGPVEAPRQTVRVFRIVDGAPSEVWVSVIA